MLNYASNVQGGSPANTPDNTPVEPPVVRLGRKVEMLTDVARRLEGLADRLVGAVQTTEAMGKPALNSVALSVADAIAEYEAGVEAASNRISVAVSRIETQF
jgi:hypothetical protein